MDYFDCFIDKAYKVSRFIANLKETFGEDTIDEIISKQEAGHIIEFFAHCMDEGGMEDFRDNHLKEPLHTKCSFQDRIYDYLVTSCSLPTLVRLWNAFNDLNKEDEDKWFTCTWFGELGKRAMERWCIESQIRKIIELCVILGTDYIEYSDYKRTVEVCDKNKLYKLLALQKEELISDMIKHPQDYNLLEDKDGNKVIEFIQKELIKELNFKS